MKDGIIIRGNIFFPDMLIKSMPIIVELSPYRKDDYMKEWSEEFFNYFTGAGYIGCLFDVRGTGRSGGNVISAEYTKQEIDDYIEIIDYLSSQSYSNGEIIPCGLSWSGTNALHVAATGHNSISAVISMMCTYDLFRGDIYYIDGLFHMDEYELEMDLDPCLPPLPDLNFDKNRFEFKPWSLEKIKHQKNDKYWTDRSVDIRKIKVPVLFIGGLYDGYRSSVNDGVSILTANGIPSLGILGPWDHSHPYRASTGPLIEIRTIMHNWLTSPEKYFGYLLFIRDNYDICDRDGFWIFTDDINDYMIYPITNQDDEFMIPYHIVGQEAGLWWGDIQEKQMEENCHVLPIKIKATKAKPFILAGTIFVEMEVYCTKKSKICMRLCTEDNYLITGGISEINEEGDWIKISVKLHTTTWSVKTETLKLILSQELWPMVWPNRTRSDMYIKNIIINIPILKYEKRIKMPSAQTFCPKIVSNDNNYNDNTDNKYIVRKYNEITCDNFRRQYIVTMEMGYNINDFSNAKWMGCVNIQYLFDNGNIEKYTVNMEVISNSITFQYHLIRQYMKNGVMIKNIKFTDIIPRKL